MNDSHDFEVKESTIHGRGVFAKRGFQSGDVVLRWDISVRISKDKVGDVSEEDKHFLVPFDSTNYIINQEPARFVNHSCSSNTEVVDFCDVATRPIEKGEEITSNYRGYSSVSFFCSCGSANCQNVIDSTEKSKEDNK